MERAQFVPQITTGIATTRFGGCVVLLDLTPEMFQAEYT